MDRILQLHSMFLHDGLRLYTLKLILWFLYILGIRRATLGMNPS